VYTALFLIFLYAPMVVLAILSFQTGPEGGPQFPIIEWSTYWYKHLFGLTPPSRIAPLPINEALVRSLVLSVMTMIVSTVLG
ncbi:ABC transporter permease, partial [Rhizobium ruizarguesonis]